MDADSSTLKPVAEETLKAIRAAGKWLQQPKAAARVGDQVPQLTRNLHKSAAAARRLAAAIDQPMAVAVFGESQVGKSHLVSVLARKGDRFLADFDGLPEPINYIERINPDKGKEATGLVTRFTLRKTKAPAGFPVHVRLFDHADILKIIANAYYFDGNPARYETWPEIDDILAHIAEFRDAAPVATDNGLSAEDVWDVEQYMQRYLAESELQKRLARADFWAVAASIVPYLSVERLSRLFSILWGRHQALSDLHCRLVTSLRHLGFAAEVFLPLTAIDLAVLGNVSVLDVECLQDLGAPSGDTIEVRTPTGQASRIQRPVVAALVAELVIRLVDRPWDWFDHTDVLDFPGYRSRGITSDDVKEEGEDNEPVGLARAFARHPSTTIMLLMLRGKVEYLFQRYVADQEITAMLLCAKESNQNVRQLPELVIRWIAATHGSKPQDRVGKPTLLFFIFTRFDVHFEQKISDDAQGLDARFVGRMDASLLKPHGSTPDTWVRNWSDGRPFTNCFLMRNPNIKTDVIVYEDVREVGIRPEKQDWVDRLRAAFLSTPSVLLHFEDPVRAFDEMLSLNDGGSGYIAEKLARICIPSTKRELLRERLASLRGRVTAMLAPFHVSTDIEKRIRDRMTVADGVLDELTLTDQRGRFGTLLQGFMIDAVQLSDHLYGAEFSAGSAVDATVTSMTATAPAPRARPGRAASAPTPITMPVLSTARRRANASVAAWGVHIYEMAQHVGFAREIGVSARSLREIANDLATTARRLGLADRLAALIEKEAFPSDPRDLQLDKASIASERLINGFVADWGMSWRPEADRPLVPTGGETEGRPAFALCPIAYDTSGIGAEPAPFGARAVDDWLFSYYRTVEENAGSEDGLDVDPTLNAEIGAIVGSLSADL